MADYFVVTLADGTELLTRVVASGYQPSTVQCYCTGDESCPCCTGSPRAVEKAEGEHSPDAGHWFYFNPSDRTEKHVARANQRHARAVAVIASGRLITGTEVLCTGGRYRHWHEV